MKITRRQLRNLIKETLEEVENTCWDGYSPGAQSGVKTKKGKKGNRVANCEEINETEEAIEESRSPNDMAPQIMENRMKITKRQLRRIIREVVEEEEINPYGTGNYSYHDEDETEEMIGHT